MSHLFEVEIPQGRPLAAEEARKLIQAAQSGDIDARNTLVEANMRLVMSIVQRFRHSGRDLDDLFQVGCVGLIKAIEKFDLSYDVAFSTYAVPVVIGEIRRHIREDRPVKVTRTLRALAQEARAARDELTQKLGRSPRPDEIAELLGVAPEELVMAFEADLDPKSLDEPIERGDANSARLGDVLALEEPDTSLESLALVQVLNRFSEEERLFVTLRYLKQWPQTRVAQSLACSQAHVSRMERRILEKLRRHWFL